jgi:hypothetical protein
MAAIRTISGVAALALALGAGCDKVKGLLGQGEAAPAEAKADPATAEGAKAAVASAPTKAEPAKAEPAPVAKADVAAAAKVEPVAAAVAADPASVAAAVPCIVGRWKGIDYIAEITRAIHRDPTLRTMKHSSSGGLFGYQVDPPTDGRGVVKAKAEELRYVFAGKVEGFQVGLTITLDGDTEAAYELVGDDTIVVSKPTKNTMKAHGVAKVEGLGKYGKSPKVEPDFDGTFVYTCDETKLVVWRDKKDSGTPVHFERE